MQNRKPRIVITCPDTGITVISRIAYEDMINPLRAPLQFKCPCGETHELKFVGPRSPGGRHNGPIDTPPIRKETSFFKYNNSRSDVLAAIDVDFGAVDV